MAYYIKKRNGRKEKGKKRSTMSLITKLDRVFSLYIRLRDSRQFAYKGFRCISCGQIKPFCKADCGHYYSRRNMATRFDEDNCNSECSYCNRFEASHLIGYRENLIRKIGHDRFDLLKIKSSQTKKWSVFELEELIKYYTALVAKMESEK